MGKKKNKYNNLLNIEGSEREKNKIRLGKEGEIEIVKDYDYDKGRKKKGYKSSDIRGLKKMGKQPISIRGQKTMRRTIPKLTVYAIIGLLIIGIGNSLMGGLKGTTGGTKSVSMKQGGQVVGVKDEKDGEQTIDKVTGVAMGDTTRYIEGLNKVMSGGSSKDIQRYADGYFMSESAISRLGKQYEKEVKEASDKYVGELGKQDLTKKIFEVTKVIDSGGVKGEERKKYEDYYKKLLKTYDSKYE